MAQWFTKTGTQGLANLAWYNAGAKFTGLAADGVAFKYVFHVFFVSTSLLTTAKAQMGVIRGMLHLPCVIEFTGKMFGRSFPFDPFGNAHATWDFSNSDLAWQVMPAVKASITPFEFKSFESTWRANLTRVASFSTFTGLWPLFVVPFGPVPDSFVVFLGATASQLLDLFGCCHGPGIVDSSDGDAFHARAASCPDIVGPRFCAPLLERGGYPRFPNRFPPSIGCLSQFSLRGAPVNCHLHWVRG